MTSCNQSTIPAAETSRAVLAAIHPGIVAECELRPVRAVLADTLDALAWAAVLVEPEVREVSALLALLSFYSPREVRS